MVVQIIDLKRTKLEFYGTMMYLKLIGQLINPTFQLKIKKI